MSMNWYHRFTGTNSDPKLKFIAKKTGHHFCFVLAVWDEILEYTNKQEQRGSLEGFDLELVASNLELDIDIIKQIFGAMYEGEKPLLCNEGVTKFVTKNNVTRNESVTTRNVTQRNAKSNAQRQSEYRERKKLQRLSEENSLRNVTSNERNTSRARVDQTQNRKESNISPYPSLPVDNFSDSGDEVLKKSGWESEGGGKKKTDFDILEHIDKLDISAAMAKAPGWDHKALAGIYNASIKSGRIQIPRQPAKAFIGWCGSYTKGKAP